MGKNHWYLFGEVAMFLTGWSVGLGKNQTQALDEERSTQTAWVGLVWGAVGVINHEKHGNSSTSRDITWYNHMGSYNYPITVVKYVLINGTAPHRCWEVVWNLLGKVLTPPFSPASGSHPCNNHISTWDKGGELHTATLNYFLLLYRWLVALLLVGIMIVW